MDLKSTELCRLCLQFSDDLVNIFDTFGDSSIASILVKHFWFQVNNNDGFTEWLCQICWIHTKTFHIYYKRMELCQRNYYRSSDLIKTDLVKQKQNISLKDEVLEPDLNIVKCEETELTEVDMQIIKENSSDGYSREYCDESESLQTSDDEDQSSYKKSKNDDVGDVNATKSQDQPTNIERKNPNWHSRSDKDKQDAQIRELFNMKCEFCSDIEFETLRAARRHYRKVHTINEGYLMCCQKKFRTRSSMLAHIVFHVNPDAYRCDQCDKYLPNEKSLKAHIQNHIPLDSRPYKCGLCSSSFRTPSILKRHERDKHTSKNGETFPCDKCNKNFRSKLLVECHIRNVHESSLKYVCEVCARRFKNKQVLRNHVEYTHSKPRPKVQCNICDAWLTGDNGLRKHLKLHGRQQKDIVNCPICKKVCKDKRLLKSHIGYAHGKKQHQCVSCDKAFMTANGLKEHIATHTGEDLYNCPYCEKKFKSNANMYSHRKKAHIAELTRDIKLKEKPTE